MGIIYSANMYYNVRPRVTLSIIIKLRLGTPFKRFTILSHVFYLSEVNEQIKIVEKTGE